MSAGRDQQLDGLRAIAVILVLYAHFLSANDSYWGHVGVRLFFVLSGFLITRLLLDARSSAEFKSLPALGAFYMRRLLRIFPPYFAMLGFVWLIELEQSRGVLVWHALYLSNFWYAQQDAWTPWVLCHTWTLAIEEQFYLVWPLLILLAPRHRIKQICVAVIVFSLVYRFYWPFTGTPSVARDVLPPASMDALGAGALLAAYRTRNSTLPHWLRRSWVPLAAAFLLLLWFAPAQPTPVEAWARWIGLEIFPLVPMVAIVWFCSNRIQTGIGRVLELPPLVALGRISYGVYLYHALVLALVVRAQPWTPVNVSDQGLGRFLIAGAATLVLASVSWLAFEKPINGLKRHFPYVARKNHTVGWTLTNAAGAVDDFRNEQEGQTSLPDPVNRPFAASRTPTN